MTDSEYEWIGIDIGGSHVTSVLINNDGVVIQKVTLSLTCRDIESVVDAIEKATHNMTKLNGVRGLGVAVPGNVDPINNVARYLPNFNWSNNINFGKILHERLNLSPDFHLSMRNDGRCAAIAESKLGCGKESKVFAFLTLGTGIGGALIINGTLFDGFTFDAGDFGHHVIRSGESDAFDCNCGKRGCFEAHASAEGLVRQYRKQWQLKIKSQTNDTACTVFSIENNSDKINAENVILMMRKGDDVAKQAFQIFLDDLATGLANLVTFYNPDTIALGGGLSQAAEIYHEIQTLVDQKTLPSTRGKVKIVPSHVGVDAGAIGAALIAKHHGCK